MTKVCAIGWFNRGLNLLVAYDARKKYRKLPHKQSLCFTLAECGVCHMHVSDKVLHSFATANTSIDVNSWPSDEFRKFTIPLWNLKFPCGIIILLPSSNSTWLFIRINFKIPLWNYNSITIIQQHLIIYAYINLQLQTSDFVDVDLACDHCYGSSKSQKNPFWDLLDP